MPWISPESCQRKCFFFLTSVVIAFNPLRMCVKLSSLRLASASLTFGKLYLSFKSITFMAWRVWDLPELGASLAGAQLVGYTSLLAFCLELLSPPVILLASFFKHYFNLIFVSSISEVLSISLL